MGLFSRPRIQFNLPSFVVELAQLCTTNRLFSLVSVYTVRKNIIRGRNAPFFRQILSPLISFSNLMIFLITEIEVIDIKFIYQPTNPRIQCFVVLENYLLF